jgi:large subunit ribosomal protein L6
VSRLAKIPIAVPDGVTATIDGATVVVKGPKGELKQALPAVVKVEQEDGRLTVRAVGGSREAAMLAGTVRALLANMVLGVTQGFQKVLDVSGAGYAARLEGKKIVLQVGYSDTRDKAIPEGVEVETPTPTRIVIRGCDKQRVGEFAAEVRAVRPPEPYKGKGIRYEHEKVRRKAGKAFVSGAK